ncbi:MAG: N-acetylmuramoyl-L-alanine amidase [Flavobacteriales bacterium]|nr:N-acetylmuramoyl-L-alanine amidase [Flavobacteriales bacterium]
MLKTLLQIIIQLLPLLNKKSAPKVEEESEEEEKYNEYVEKEHEKDFKLNFHQSPNYRKGINKSNTCIILHHTAGKSFKSDLNWMLNPESKVSAHYLIGEQGEIAQLVKDKDIAWHAGKSEWNGKSNVNNFSIGIECSGDTTKKPFTDIQFDALVFLVKKLKKEYDIPLSDIISHREIAPGRKVDLDPKNFDWEKFYVLVG